MDRINYASLQKTLTKKEMKNVFAGSDSSGSNRPACEDANTPTCNGYCVTALNPNNKCIHISGMGYSWCACSG